MHVPDELPEESKLANIIRDVIQQWTRISPMSIEEIVQALAFTTGYAIANRPKADRKRISTKFLRQMAGDRLDRGIAAAEASNGEMQIILPSANVNKIGTVQ